VTAVCDLRPTALGRSNVPIALAGFATVKAVLSGDTVVLQGKATTAGAPPPEMQLSLSSLAAPRLSRHPEARDEPFGWASREFLRKALIGRPVRFRVDYKVEKIARSFATLWLTGPEGPEAESVNLKVARAGWARPTSAELSKQGASPVSGAAAAHPRTAGSSGPSWHEAGQSDLADLAMLSLLNSALRAP
jgi:endonuclease YncB( thermonuclease family)